MRNLKIIKFRRKGNLRHHLFDIVVTHKQKRFNGSFVEKIGFFNPYSPKIF